MKILDNNFKTIMIAIYSINIDNCDTHAYRFLLSKMITSHNDRLNTKRKMAIELENMYGSYLSSNSNIIGNANVITTNIIIPNPVLVNDDKLVSKTLKMIKESIFSDRDFDEEVLNIAKKNAIDSIKSIVDDKRKFASHEFSKHFYNNLNISYPKTGTIEDIEKITVESIKKYYLDVYLKEDKHVITSGNIDNRTKKALLKNLSFSLKENISILVKNRKENDNSVIKNTAKMKQSQIRIGYNLPIFKDNEYKYAAALMNIILGGYPESRLFKVIREKEGLCYNISSSYSNLFGTLTISTGVDSDKTDYAYDKIIEVVNDLKNILDDELVHAKKFAVELLTESLDNQYTTNYRAFIEELTDQKSNIKDEIEKFQQVNINDINEVSKKLKLDTTYILYGDENAKN